MDADKMDIYHACDMAIKAMDRQNVELFGRLKLMNWDRINVIQTVKKVYRESARKARKRYYGVCFESYTLGLILCGTPAREAHEMAEKAISMAWVDKVLDQTDYVTLYRFDSETERKAMRLAEALEAAQDRNYEIDKALRLWTRQLGQYAINFTDYAMIQAYTDAGIERVEWISQKDIRVCNECHVLDGQIFNIDEIPPKPHWRCRCHWKAILNG